MVRCAQGSWLGSGRVCGRCLCRRGWDHSALNRSAASTRDSTTTTNHTSSTSPPRHARSASTLRLSLSLSLSLCVSAGSMPTEAPYLRQTRTYLYDTIRDAILTCARKPTWVSLIYRTVYIHAYMHASESTLDSGTSGTASHSSRHDMLVVISSRYQYGPFLFCCRSVSNYLTTDGLKNFSLLPETPLRPEARGICHICHMVNPALLCVCLCVSVCVCVSALIY